jgi:GNAT superfamily N-acetyltransferase
VAISDLAIVEVAPASQEATRLMTELDAEIGCRYPGVVPHGLHRHDFDDPRTVFLVARVGGVAVGCGAIRGLEPGVAEIKRMFVQDAARGSGVGRRILAALESRARAAGYMVLRLETGMKQPEAIALYTSAGFAAVEAFGEYIGNEFSRCFEKKLV